MGFITSATVISFGVGPLVVGALRRTIPDRPRPFRVPGGDTIPLLAFYSANMIVYWAGWATNSKLFLTILLGYIVLVVFRVVDRANNDRTLLDIRAGASWIVPWFAAMALISWACDPATHPQLFVWVFLVNIVVTIAIYYLAIRMRLPRTRIEAFIRETDEEASDDDHVP